MYQFNGPGDGPFFQIADDETRLVGIRSSTHPNVALEVVALDQTTGRVNTIGFYPYRHYSLVMVFARQRRIYSNIISSSLFCGVNVDSGILDSKIYNVKKTVPSFRYEWLYKSFSSEDKSG
jgi:hypothetical protein